MTNYIEISIETSDTAKKEMLIAQLSEIQFEGFEETEKNLKAFIPQNIFIEELLEAILETHHLTYSSLVIPQQNWNALWESNFEPVVVDDFCVIRADFHQPSNQTEHEIIITPKMSFGTGHHATTFMMVQQMKHIDFTEKTVADFGMGTGILAILAEKLGAQKVLALDHDDWCIENAAENIERNNSTRIQLEKGNAFNRREKFDIILANINKNVILDNLNGLVFGLNQHGLLLISGILKEDENDMIEACASFELTCLKTLERNNWISILFKL
jgi:ribosomal protein L11 methyltransferase